MHPKSILTTTILLTAATHAQLIPFLTHGEPAIPQNVNPNSRPSRLQRSMDPNSNSPGIQLPNPPSTGGNDNSNDAVILSDVIGSDSSINIFAGFTRSVSTVSTRLETSALNTTVLAPLNKAITALPRKPWEDPRDYAELGASAYHGDEGEDRAQRNMRRFAEAHVVPASPWEEGVKVETMGGRTLWWEKKDGKAVVMPGEVVVERVAQKVANGEVWVVEGVLNYAQ